MTWAYVFYSYILLPAVALAYIVVGVWLTYRVASRRRAMFSKFASAITIPLIFLLVPTADVVVGRATFAQLCKSEAATKVFRTVTLDQNYRRSDGSLKTEILPGSVGYKISDRYVMMFSEDQVLAWPRIVRAKTEIRDTRQGDVLGEVVNFRYWGGWLVHQMPGHLSADSCPNMRDRSDIDRLVFAAP